MKCPSIKDLPLPPVGKSGWPWTEETPQLPELAPNGLPWPRISIVTPSYNQGQFLEETLRSVLLQAYPDLEYIVIDGGSTDGSADIIRKYEAWLAYWETAPDRGQSHAINKGWDRATGRLIAYLNSDDTYLPGALATAASTWMTHAEPVMVTGAVLSTDADSRIASACPSVPRLSVAMPADLTTIDHERWFLPQQSSFFSAVALDTVGRWVREDLHFVMDRELIYRLCRIGVPLLLSHVLATYRHHDRSKTVSKVLEFYREDRKGLECWSFGSWTTRLRRRRIARWRMAQGHYRFARAAGRWVGLLHLGLAASKRPGYLARRGFWSAGLRCAGLYKLSQRVRSALRRAPH